MENLKVNETFPCGYEIYMELSSWVSDPELTGVGDGCPLHDKKCSSKDRKVKG